MIRGLARIGAFAFGMTLSLNTLLKKEDNSNQAEFSVRFVRHTPSNLFISSS